MFAVTVFLSPLYSGNSHSLLQTSSHRSGPLSTFHYTFAYKLHEAGRRCLTCWILSEIHFAKPLFVFTRVAEFCDD